MNKGETASGRKLSAFQDIVVTGMDDRQTNRPDKNKLLYDVYLQLSALPPHEWIQIFQNERSFPRHTMWRDARIVGQAVVVRCGLDEVERYHLHDIRQDIETSNKRYREYLEQCVRKEMDAEISAQQERKGIMDLKSRLKF